MGVVSRARNAKIKLSIQDVLRSKSIVHLAQLAKVAPSLAAPQGPDREQTGQAFTLSPIQNLYLKSAIKHNDGARFNQSFTLGVSRNVTVQSIKRAIDSIVQRHAMLRARFARTQTGGWEQHIAKVTA